MNYKKWIKVLLLVIVVLFTLLSGKLLWWIYGQGVVIENSKDNYINIPTGSEYEDVRKIIVDSGLIKNIKADIFYLDPPYNQRQYAPNYHLLETIARYDNPKIKGVTGLRDYKNQKSNFCNAKNAINELSEICKRGQYKTLILSYNSEGIMPGNKIISTMKKYGQVELVEFEYLRFKSNNNGESKTKKHIHEQLYILKKC